MKAFSGMSRRGVLKKNGAAMNFYNENNPHAAAWLRELIAAGEIPPGCVDERSITEINAKELKRFKQCHFFAGIGGWPLAFRLAGIPDDEPIWSGSCPCQPFSDAGKGMGKADERHLWPYFRNHIGQCRPSIVFGEQVASAAGEIWLAGVRADMERAAYSFGAADLCAAGVSAPQTRQRFFWVADAHSHRRKARISVRQTRQNKKARFSFRNGQGHGVADAHGYDKQWWSGPLQVGWNAIEGTVTRGGRPFRGQWRIKPGLSLLADGVPGRVAQLCGFGNAIVPQVAAEFIQAYLETKAGGVR